jgi:hypothetical protein
MVQDVQEHPAQLGQVDDDLAAYRPLSRMAIVGLLTGLASFLALAHPVLWVVPPLAGLFCWWGLRNIRVSDGALIGRSAAIAGIMLAMFFAAAAISNFSLRRAVTRQQAEAMADKWIQLVEAGALQHAHQWVLPYVSREAPGVPLQDYYESEEGRTGYSSFLKDDPGKSLSQMTEEDRIEKLGCIDVAITRRNRFVNFQYRLIRAGQEPMDFGLIVRRFTDPDTSFHSWTARPYMPEDESDAE